MSFIRCKSVFAIVGAISASGVLAVCGTTSVWGSAVSPAASSSATPSSDAFMATDSPGTAPASPAGSAACNDSGAYLTAIRVARHSGYDRVVFQFSGQLPRHDVSVVNSVVSDPVGDELPLAGQAYLHVVFLGASAYCWTSAHSTYSGPSVLTPFYPELLVISKAGDFEGTLSFGIGLAARGGYHVSTLTNPYRVVIDVTHVQLGKFPGIWDITSWQQYWDVQYSVNNGHQPWLINPAMVVEAWARSKWPTTPVIHQVSQNTFRVTEPSGRIDTITSVRLVSVPVPGPWVITKIVYGR
jgi:hypothetical protein